MSECNLFACNNRAEKGSEFCMKHRNQYEKFKEES